MRDGSITELLKLAYDTSKDKYDENRVPEAFYVLIAISNMRALIVEKIMRQAK